MKCILSLQKRGANRLGLALLLKFFQLQGHFPSQKDEIPRIAQEFVAQQLNLSIRHYQDDGIILFNVRWYCRYSLSYRDLEERMAERGLCVDHSTIHRWVLQYAPELDTRCCPYLRPTGKSWKVDETGSALFPQPLQSVSTSLTITLRPT